MTHIQHEIAAMRLRYVPFNYPAMAWHLREGNRKINERLSKLGAIWVEPLTDPIVSDA